MFGHRSLQNVYAVSSNTGVGYAVMCNNTVTLVGDSNIFTNINFVTASGYSPYIPIKERIEFESQIEALELS